MTATTTERDAALARLREVVKPGDTVYVTAQWSRSADTCEVTAYAVGENRSLYRLDLIIAKAFGIPRDPRRAPELRLSGDFTLDAFSDRLSVALFGEPGQIKGEYL